MTTVSHMHGRDKIWGEPSCFSFDLPGHDRLREVCVQQGHTGRTLLFPFYPFGLFWETISTQAYSLDQTEPGLYRRGDLLINIASARSTCMCFSRDPTTASLLSQLHCDPCPEGPPTQTAGPKQAKDVGHFISKMQVATA